MPPKHTEELQQRMYGLYHRYYNQRKVNMLKNDDFHTGTFRIRSPGLYVITEDIVFNPDSHYLTTNEDYTGHPMFSMGFFAAITVECNGVIIDLQGHSIRQSYEHYFEQRFFTIVELARSAFIEGQGPGSVQSSESEAQHVASDCMILNGTLGLSSHSSIHGNNNTCVVLQNLTLRDFEVAGIQLNGVHNAFIDRVYMQGAECAPVASEAFSMLLHLKELTVNADLYADGSGEESPSTAELQTIADALRAPFRAADESATQDKDIQVPNRLKDIHAQLKVLAQSDDTLTRFITETGLPDGSAVYGILLNSTGAAVNKLVEACASTGNACACPVATENRTTCHRYARDVSIHKVTIRNLRLHSVEHVVLRRGGGDGGEDTIVRDFTGATIRLPLLSASSSTVHPFDFARATVGEQKESFDDAVLSYLRGVTVLSQLLDDTTATTSFAYNADVMAHVSKGILGIRAESVQRLCVEHTQVADINNSTVPHHPTEYAPETASFVSLTAGSPDSSTAKVFAGADLRAVFVGNCQQVYMYRLSLSRLVSNSGFVRACEFAKTMRGTVHSVHTSDVSGRHVSGIMVQNDCRDFRMQNNAATRLALSSHGTDAQWSSDLTESEKLVALKRLTRYAPALDPRAFVCEAVAVLKAVQF